ncbi:MAG: ankyrin repeat domain-containing protein [Candidatus Rhabdochlamydia sp.]
MLSAAQSSKSVVPHAQPVYLRLSHNENNIFEEKQTVEEGSIQHSPDYSISQGGEIPSKRSSSLERELKELSEICKSLHLEKDQDITDLKENTPSQEFCLHEAASQGDLAFIKQEIASKKSIDTLNLFQQTPLYLAVIHNHLDVVCYLLDMGASPLFPKGIQETLLHVIAFYGYEEMLRKVIVYPEIQKLLNIKDREGRQPLHKLFFKNPHSQIVQILLDAGACANETDYQGYKPLHWAAQKGCLNSVKILLKKEVSIAHSKLDACLLNPSLVEKEKALSQESLSDRSLFSQSEKLIDAVDLFQRTPLHLATIHGHLDIVCYLLDEGANPVFSKETQETILHVAAFYGHNDIIQKIITRPNVKELLNMKDKKGRQPLHKVFFHRPNPQVVRILLEAKAPINEPDDEGYTPLYWAAQQKCVESVDLLLQKGAFITCRDSGCETSLEKIHQMLDIPSPASIPVTSDKLAYYTNCLLRAKKTGSIKEQVVVLIKLSDYSMQESHEVDHNKPLRKFQAILNAAKFLNCALAILKDNIECNYYQELEAAIIIKIGLIEQNFIENQGFIAPKENHLIEGYRLYLKTSRMACSSEIKDSFIASKNLTQHLANLMKSLFQQGIAIFGEPPVRWTAMSLGSMARKEMCPYSDLDYGFLIESATPEALVYFKRLSWFLQLRITNLGETPYPIFGELEPSPTPKGFRFDGIGENELIGTPSYFIQFLTAKKMNENIIFTNALYSTGYIDGDLQLIKQYEEERDRISCEKIDPASKPFHEILGMYLLKEHLLEFKPNLSIEKEKLKAFGIKKELYRPIQEVINGLALFFNIKEKNSLDRIDALVKLNVFSENGAQKIKDAFHHVLLLRIKAHLFYQSEEEIVFHRESHQNKDPHKFYIDPSIEKQLTQIYDFIEPFFHAIKKFTDLPYKETLDKETFDAHIDYNNIFRQSHAQELKKHIQRSLALNTDAIENLLEISSLGESPLERAQQALTLAQQLEEGIQKDKIIARCYSYIATALLKMKKHKEFEQAYKQLNAVLLKFGKNYTLFSLAKDYNHAGHHLKDLEQYLEAQREFIRAIQCIGELRGFIKYDKQLGRENYQELHADSCMNLGFLLEVTHEHSLEIAIGCYEEALLAKLSYPKENILNVSIKGKREKQLEISDIFTQIGALYFKVKKPNRAIWNHRKALNILLSMKEKNSSLIGDYAHSIGAYLHEIGKLREAIIFYQKAIEIRKAAKASLEEFFPTSQAVCIAYMQASRLEGDDCILLGSLTDVDYFKLAPVPE